MSDQAAPPEAASGARPPGRRAIKVGTVMLVLAAIAIPACLAYGLYFAKWAGDVEVFEMPGTVSKELSEGSAAIYTELEGGSHVQPPEEAYTVTGPGEVDVIVYGLYADISQLRLDGKIYTLAAKLEVPQDGTYEITVARDRFEGTEPAVVGRYTSSENWRFLMILLANLFGLIGIIGLIVLLVGLLRRRLARSRTPATS